MNGGKFKIPGAAGPKYSCYDKFLAVFFLLLLLLKRIHDDDDGDD